MGQLTFKMMGVVISSLLIFALAQAENRAEKDRKDEDQKERTTASKPSSKEDEKEKKAMERFRAQQSIQRALRDQGMQHGPVLPSAPPPKSK